MAEFLADVISAVTSSLLFIQEAAVNCFSVVADAISAIPGGDLLLWLAGRYVAYVAFFVTKMTRIMFFGLAFFGPTVIMFVVSMFIGGALGWILRFAYGSARAQRLAKDLGRALNEGLRAEARFLVYFVDELLLYAPPEVARPLRGVLVPWES
ncbi:hypothetical protein F4779DRAFT_616844 [Xylariaceae sp. FL0662B]|nr:hypothetical protein F4779DRAFT_616844 [Xylariaceae sp. FL0662B]